MEKMDKSKDLPRGLEGLRKLADDVCGDFWSMLAYGTEKDWHISTDHKGSLRDTLSRLADEIESERPALTDAECRVLELWPRYEDDEPVWFGDVVAMGLGNIGVEAIEFTSCGVNAKDGQDGDWSTSIPAKGRLKRPAPEVLDADGVPIHKGELLYGIGRSQHLFSVLDPHHVDPEVGSAFSVKCIDLTEAEECHCRPELLSHNRPDSWERLEKDAREFARDNQLPHDVDQMERDALDLIRRAKALAGVER